MPTIENIERFKQKLIEIGNEPEIAAERGEQIVDVRPPEAEDLSALLGIGDSDSGAAGAEAPDGTAETEDFDFDFGSLDEPDAGLAELAIDDLPDIPLVLKASFGNLIRLIDQAPQ